jgi:enoyl-CoA hydratase/carnithine racemase
MPERDMCRGIVDAVEGASEDSSIGAVLLDAKGDVFCAGMDLDEAASPEAAQYTPSTSGCLPWALGRANRSLRPCRVLRWVAVLG